MTSRFILQLKSRKYTQNKHRNFAANISLPCPLVQPHPNLDCCMSSIVSMNEHLTDLCKFRLWSLKAFCSVCVSAGLFYPAITPFCVFQVHTWFIETNGRGQSHDGSCTVILLFPSLFEPAWLRKKLTSASQKSTSSSSYEFSNITGPPPHFQF